jgi:hypothetical protein
MLVGTNARRAQLAERRGGAKHCRPHRRLPRSLRGRSTLCSCALVCRTSERQLAPPAVQAVSCRQA